MKTYHFAGAKMLELLGGKNRASSDTMSYFAIYI